MNDITPFRDVISLFQLNKSSRCRGYIGPNIWEYDDDE